MKRRVRSNKNETSGLRYTFHSYGTQFPFNPFKTIYDDRIVNEANYFESMSQLDFYKHEVRSAKNCGQKHVYILDNLGNELRV